ncbi:hypothetical protein PG985_011396 [Apiospora marii]|uniref:uncharacterized protein n=1 Tax=Apiospora marii TaxID=335849 RepID=UPI00312E092D
MSGFEVAGLVLGAIPLALELLKHYEDAAHRLNYWRKIQVEYLHCKGELELQVLLFKKNLRRLLLPLDMGDTEIDTLLANPNDPAWKDPSVESRLEARLQDTYRHYLEYVKRLEQTMKQLKDLLAVDSVEVQGHLAKPRDSWTFKGLKTKVLDSEWWGYEKYRIRFANSAKDRHRLLEELDKYNTKLEKILRTSDEDTRLVTDREHAIVDDKLCSFWIQATRIYSALSNHWDCGCESQADHSVRVALAHRIQSTQGFELAWTRTRPLLCDTCYLQIDKADSLIYALEKMSVHRSGAPQKPQPKKSSMKGKGAASGKSLRAAIPSVKISTPLVPAAGDMEIDKISTICASLHVFGKGCVGYIQDENSIYYVHQDPKPRKFAIALDDLVRSQLGQPPSRRQRCQISLAVASSFMQLLDTPWMPPNTHPEIVFTPDDKYYNPELVLEYASLPRQNAPTVVPKPSNSPPPTSDFFGPMEFLGVLLLEFCFWSLLEAHPLRASFPKAKTEMEKLAFDLAAAQSWRTKVLEHSGLDYKKAVDWCFQGHKDISSASWRKDMFRNVIQPLEQCHNFPGTPSHNHHLTITIGYAVYALSTLLVPIDVEANLRTPTAAPKPAYPSRSFDWPSKENTSFTEPLNIQPFSPVSILAATISFIPTRSSLTYLSGPPVMENTNEATKMPESKDETKTNGPCIVCGKKTERTCFTCGEDFVCSWPCNEADNLLAVHNPACDKHKETSADDILSCIGGDRLPVRPQTVKDFGFDRCLVIEDKSQLMGTYRTLVTTFGVRAPKLHEWRVAQELHPNIAKIFGTERAKNNVPVVYLDWFKKHAYVFDGGLHGSFTGTQAKETGDFWPNLRGRLDRAFS